MPNEHYLRISDKAYIEEPMELDSEYSISGVVTTDGASKKSDNEGGYKYTYLAKFTSHVELKKGEKVIKVKDKKKWSQKMRYAIETNELDYENFMGWLMAEQLDGLMEKYKNKV